MAAKSWRKTLLGDCASLNGGFGFSDRFQGEAEGELPFFKVSDMSTPGNERFLFSANNYVSRTTALRQGWKPAPPKGVAFAKVGAALLLNRRRVLSTDSLVDNNMMVAVAGAEMDPTWLYWWLQTIDFGVFVQPGALPSVNQAQLRRLDVLLPELAEQRGIAEILDTLDEAIRRTEQVIAKLQRMKQGLLHDLLTRGVDENGEVRPLVEEAPHLYKNSPLGRIPQVWTVPLIDELAVHVGSGVTPRGGSETYLSSGVPLIRSQNVHFDGLRLDDVAFISATTHRAMARSEVFPNDVLLNITGASIGRCCTVPRWLGMANVNQHVCAIRLPESTSTDAQWLSSFLGSPFGQHQVDVLNAGSNRQGLNYQQVRAFRVLWPERSERERAVAVIATQDDRDLQERRSLGKLRAIKTALLHDLLTGQVRVPLPIEASA